MQLKQLLQEISAPSHLGSTLVEYRQARKYFRRISATNQKDSFQSPSINPSTDIQRGKIQNDKEHSVYQRSDFTPVSIEGVINSNFNSLDGVIPFTLCFNSGMATISTVLFYLKMSCRSGPLYIGENAYFETKWLVQDYPDVFFYNEYDPQIREDIEILWMEHPINCTQPNKYPFNEMPNPFKLIEKFIDIVKNNPTNRYYLVIDYTLFYFKFEISVFINKLPKNLSVLFITSLQKHRGYGLDLVNSGAVTCYTSDPEQQEYLKRLRAIMGTSITQEMIWMMPTIKSNLINTIIFDSGINAKNIYSKIVNTSKNVSVYFSNNNNFLTSFIFLKINNELVKKISEKPYASERLIAKLIKSAKKHNVTLVNGTSFGWPFSRIFKNSERHENTDSIRIAVGYDEQMVKNLDLVIQDGISSFEASL